MVYFLTMPKAQFFFPINNRLMGEEKGPRVGGGEGGVLGRGRLASKVVQSPVSVVELIVEVVKR